MGRATTTKAISPDTMPSTPAEPISIPAPAKIQSLLDKSAVFSSAIGKLLSTDSELLALPSISTKNSKSKSKKVTVEDKRKFEEMEVSKVEMIGRQSSLITGGTLKDYQLRGVAWMKSLYVNGVNGILADEQGLGKTLQTIAFLADLYESGSTGPFLIVCPMSVLSVWEEEFTKFAPSIDTLLYHGTRDVRQEMRETKLGFGAAKRSKTVKKLKQLPVILTSYEMIIADATFLRSIEFEYIVVDEGQRLKNSETLFSKELRSFSSANKLLLTGTPIQNSLTELWSLLNFLMPLMFNNLEHFKSYFDFSKSDAVSSSVVSQIHSILKPFMLRRLKTDVEKDLPPKKEYLLYAPLTVEQNELYASIVNRDVKSFLLKKQLGYDGYNDDVEKPIEHTEGVITTRTKGNAAIVPDFDEMDDEDFFDKVQAGEIKTAKPTKSVTEIGREYSRKQATKYLSGRHLTNVIMNLRKCVNHPALFHDRPIEDSTDDADGDKHALLASSGKMLLLNRLLFGKAGLFATGHKVVLFSQFTSQLDIIHSWFNDVLNLEVYRIDGSTKREDRQSQMKAFNSPHDPLNVKLFLLSTRAGGVGITLIAADTVILFDSDWNPQCDVQAQDRVHRIGQKNPVLVFRFTTATIEARILARTKEKRKLESLIIGQGDYSMEDMVDALDSKRASKIGLDLESILAALESQEQHLVLAKEGDLIFSDEDLANLLDRSDEMMRSKSSFSKDVEVLTEVEKPGGLKLDVEVITISSDAEEEEEPKPISKKPKSK